MPPSSWSPGLAPPVHQHYVASVLMSPGHISAHKPSQLPAALRGMSKRSDSTSKAPARLSPEPTDELRAWAFAQVMPSTPMPSPCLPGALRPQSQAAPSAVPTVSSSNTSPG